ncbi:MAG: acyl-CoA dehydrogenase family protein, partial [Myxococcota bacterium]
MAEPFHGTDLYRIDGLLSDEERLVRDNVASWVDQRWMPIVTEHYRNGTFPVELAPELGEMGLLGTSLKGYGCPSMSSVVYGLAMEELERGDSGLRSFASVQGSLAMYPIWAFGSE